MLQKTTHQREEDEDERKERRRRRRRQRCPSFVIEPVLSAFLVAVEEERVSLSLSFSEASKFPDEYSFVDPFDDKEKELEKRNSG